MEQFTLNIFYLKKKVIFPYCSLAVYVRPTDESKAIQKGERVLAYTIRSTLDLLRYRNRLATLSEVTEVQVDGNAVKIGLKGLSRVVLKNILRYKLAEFDLIGPQQAGSHEAIRDELRKKSQELVFLINVEESDKLIKLLNYIVDCAQMTDFISNYFIMDFRMRYRLYNQVDTLKRAEMLVDALNALIRKMTRKRKKTES